MTTVNQNEPNVQVSPVQGPYVLSSLRGGLSGWIDAPDGPLGTVYPGIKTETREIDGVTFTRTWESRSPEQVAATALLFCAAPEMHAALLRIQAEPHGCRFCDSGTLRTPGNPAKDHDENCGYVLLAVALKKAEGR